MDEKCIFCNIIAGKIPGDIVYQDDNIIALRDISPQAPTHLLVMPKKHIPSLNDLDLEQEELTAYLIQVARQLAKKEGVAERGYRLAVNCGKEGGQIVPHVHFHLLGGRQLSGALG
ncbi:MAG: histidine triad nucleotide-binding protein [Chloroflexi bacterium RBG_13_54_8]|nr:MAG: histidine triad nucleotide-binding protein [Chloroflexi bacterium RBG_13_54_8]